MAKKEASSTKFKFFSGAIGSVLDKSKGAFRSDGENSGSENAYARRREQVRRAQRKHRERKEEYIRHLENRILELREDVALRQDYQEASVENSVLKSILRAHNITIPNQQHPPVPSSIMQVSVVGTAAEPQMLQARYSPVSIGSSNHPSSVGHSEDASLATRMQQASVSPSGISPISQNCCARSPSDMLGSQTPETVPSKPHPHGLDSTQTGVDFVLLLEKPCLQHTMQPLQAGEPHGHALTLQASLLSHAPHLGADQEPWAVPAIEFDRLLELSHRLDLDGEVTPVQAWSRIKSHHRFQDLTPTGLEALQNALSSKISCFGFGAVIEEFELSDIIDAHLGK